MESEIKVLHTGERPVFSDDNSVKVGSITEANARIDINVTE